MNSTPKRGIKEQILSAPSYKEIELLLIKARDFKYAHPSTVRKWERAASMRRAQLGKL